jgi:hypothetical protein
MRRGEPHLFRAASPLVRQPNVLTLALTAELRDEGQINPKIREYADVDAYGKDAMAGVSLAQKWVGE